MFNAASKISFTVAVVAALTGFGAVFTTNDRVAFTALVFAGVLAAAVGVATFYFAPRDPVVPVSAEVEAATVRSIDLGDVPKTSPWPIVGAVAATVLGVGVALGKGLVTIGLILAAVALFGWMAQVWREHPSWTQAMTDRMNDRFVVPVGLPVLVILLIGISAVSLSRIFLAVSAEAAPVIAIVAAAAILFAFWLLSKRDDVSVGILTVLAIVAGALVIGAGVAGAIAGEREFHEAGGEEHGAAAEDTFHLSAENLAFDTESLQMPANSEVVLEFENGDDASVQHNFALYTEEGGDPLFQGEVTNGGDTAEYEFSTPEPGSYYFQCDVHPAEMNGEVEVVEAASEDPTDVEGNPATTTTTTEH